jgi:hypothetical protein
MLEHVSKEGGMIIDVAVDAKRKIGRETKGEEKDDEKRDVVETEEAESEAEKKSRLRNGGDTNHALVRSLIALRAHYGGIVGNCFENMQIFQKSLKRAFEEFINRDGRVSKLLAQFVNESLKKGNKVTSAARFPYHTQKNNPTASVMGRGFFCPQLGITDMESVLDNVVLLYGYIHVTFSLFPRVLRLSLTSGHPALRQSLVLFFFGLLFFFGIF